MVSTAPGVMMPQKSLRSITLKRSSEIAVLGLRVIDEKPRQVEQAREPGDHEDDVQRLDPEHGQAENLLRAKRMASA